MWKQCYLLANLYTIKQFIAFKMAYSLAVSD